MDSRRLRRLGISSVASLGVLLAVAVASSSWSPPPGWARRELAGTDSSLLLALLLVAMVSVALAVISASRIPPGGSESGEEPLIEPASMFAVRRPHPVIAIIGLEPMVGASTLAFNAAVYIAAEGIVSSADGHVRARPVCLLAEGSLTASLGLSADPLEQYLADHPGYVRSDVVDLVSEHPAGFDLMCLRPGRVESSQLPRLIELLRSTYDAVLVDCAFGAERFSAAAAHGADAVLVCGLPTRSSELASGACAMRAWELGQEGRTGIVINRVMATTRIPKSLARPYLYRAAVPEDAEIAERDRDGRPWVLSGDRSAARLVANSLRQLLPAFFATESDAA